jgi:hypothetical protein
MKKRVPPRFALRLLERFGPDATPLAGDLIEEFDRKQSPAWFWWQVLAAIWVASFARSDEIRPLRLVDLQPADAAERSRRMTLRFRPVNLTASPVPGVGGLGLVALSLLVTLVIPAAWALLVASILAGVVLGIAMILRGRRRLA